MLDILQNQFAKGVESAAGTAWWSPSHQHQTNQMSDGAISGESHRTNSFSGLQKPKNIFSVEGTMMW